MSESEIPDINTEAEAFLAALGDELRRARERRGWTRQDLVDRLGADISTNTLATYEFGTRGMGLARLFHLCLALDVRPRDLVERAWDRVVGSDTFVYVDLARLARTTAERLRPLRPWAQLRVDELSDGDRTEVPFIADALDSMAALCRIDRVELVDELVSNGIARQPHNRTGGVDT
ncbi:MAG: helix-turn-helix domain-containing protein [Actinophytocola sp.]|uniref:helix-turn-helix domain-containing protein n=1 Tax=Actinophytocola sp. TaxID=1872138 RepID=UPI001329B30F|nr:helix-turn-helix transcriptional regulator [Actinophytocola sp.]MPZ84700.1 helix-turn-helix domain-containing protein [Actinophytocola sp.]